MRNPALTLFALLGCVVGLALLALAGPILLVATPLFLYFLASWLIPARVPELEITRSLGRDRANPDEPVEITIRVRNTGPALHLVRIEDLIPDGVRVVDGSTRCSTTLAIGEEVHYRYTVTGTRGSYEFDEIVVSSRSVISLASARQTLRIPQELVMLPHHRSLERIPIAPRRTLVYAGTNRARLGGEGTEFFDIREHRGSAAVRHVNWRASARFEDRVFVNEFEEERVADVAVLLDCRLRAYPAPATGELFDAAASAAASFSDLLLDSGNRVGYLGYGLSLDWLTPGFGKVQKQRLLTRIARAYPGESHVFSTFEALPERLFPAGSQVIVVSPLMANDLQAIERLSLLGYAVMVVTPNPIPLIIPERTDRVGSDAARLLRLERAVLLQRLRHSGSAVIDWDTQESLERAVARSFGQIMAAWRARRVR